MAAPAVVKVKLVRSPISCTQRQRQTLRALGLTRMGKTSIVHQNPPMLGRIALVRHLIEVLG